MPPGASPPSSTAPSPSGSVFQTSLPRILWGCTKPPRQLSILFPDQQPAWGRGQGVTRERQPTRVTGGGERTRYGKRGHTDSTGGQHNTEGRVPSREEARPRRLFPCRGLQSNDRRAPARPGTGPPSSAPLHASLPCSEFDFELCGLCGHRGPRGLEERLQDGVWVHFGRRVGRGGRVQPPRQLAVLLHRGAVTQPQQDGLV